jgi:hypothetical protein
MVLWSSNKNVYEQSFDLLNENEFDFQGFWVGISWPIVDKGLWSFSLTDSNVALSACC